MMVFVESYCPLVFLYLIFLETLSGVCEREEPGLDRGEMVADGLFLCEDKCLPI